MLAPLIKYLIIISTMTTSKRQMVNCIINSYIQIGDRHVITSNQPKMPVSAGEFTRMSEDDVHDKFTLSVKRSNRLRRRLHIEGIPAPCVSGHYIFRLMLKNGNGSVSISCPYDRPWAYCEIALIDPRTDGIASIGLLRDVETVDSFNELLRWLYLIQQIFVNDVLVGDVEIRLDEE